MKKYLLFTKCCRKAPCFSNGDTRQHLVIINFYKEKK